jgi:hypothetical protein
MTFEEQLEAAKNDKKIDSVLAEMDDIELSEEQLRMAVRQNGFDIQYIEKPSLGVILEAVKYEPACVEVMLDSQVTNELINALLELDEQGLSDLLELERRHNEGEELTLKEQMLLDSFLNMLEDDL